MNGHALSVELIIIVTIMLQSISAKKVNVFFSHTSQKNLRRIESLVRKLRTSAMLSKHLASVLNKYNLQTIAQPVGTPGLGSTATEMGYHSSRAKKKSSDGNPHLSES